MKLYLEYFGFYKYSTSDKFLKSCPLINENIKILPELTTANKCKSTPVNILSKT